MLTCKKNKNFIPSVFSSVTVITIASFQGKISTAILWKEKNKTQQLL